MQQIYNVPLTAAVISWVITQFIKTIFYIIKFKTFNPERILGAGGMPSSHSAAVCSLVVVIYRLKGSCSNEFALAMILAMIVMYDALGVRRAAGMHAKELNRIKRIILYYQENPYKNKVNEEIIIKNDENETKGLKEYLGHTPIEVICGAFLGIVIGVIIVT